MKDKQPRDRAIKNKIEQTLFAPSILRSTRQAKHLRYIFEQNLNNSDKTLDSFYIPRDFFNQPVSEEQSDALISDFAVRTQRSLENHYDASTQKIKNQPIQPRAEFPHSVAAATTFGKSKYEGYCGKG